MIRSALLGTNYLILAFLVTGAAYASHTHAQAPGEERREALEANMEERRDAVIESIEERHAAIASSTEEFREQLAEHKAAYAKKVQDRIYNLTQNIRGRMGAAIHRLEHIAGRIETRTDKVDLDEATKGTVRDHVTDARTSLRDASALLSPDLGLFIQSDKPREKFGEVFSTIKKAGQDIRNARESLRAALAVLKGIPATQVMPEDESATSTEGIRVQ